MDSVRESLGARGSISNLEGLGVQDHFWLPSISGASLGYMELCQENNSMFQMKLLETHTKVSVSTFFSGPRCPTFLSLGVLSFLKIGTKVSSVLAAQWALHQ